MCSEKRLHADSTGSIEPKPHSYSGQNHYNGLQLLDDLVSHLQVGDSTDECQYYLYRETDSLPKEVNLITEGRMNLQPVGDFKVLRRLYGKLLRTQKWKRKSSSRYGSHKRKNIGFFLKKKGKTYHLPAFQKKTLETYKGKLGVFYSLSGTCSGIQALYFSRAVLEVIYDDIPQADKFPINELLEIFYVSSQWSIDTFTKCAKYFTVVPMARFLKNEYPEKPKGFGNSDPLVFKGRLKKIIKNRLISYTNTKAAHLPWSLLQGVKRACFEIPAAFKQSEYEKHAKDLNNMYDESHDPVAALAVDTGCDYFERTLKWVKPIKEYELFEPSTSACWERTRDQGGAREQVRALLDYFGILEQTTGYTLTEDMDIQVLKSYNLNDPNIRNSIIHALYETYKDKQYLNVMVHGIAEPLKFRKITKGEAGPYWIARKFQKSMWNYLQTLGNRNGKADQFAPTGRPLELSDIHFLDSRRQALEEHLRLKLPEVLDIKFDKWVSGDYSAATDLVDMRVTLKVFETFADKFDIDEETRDLCRKVIGPQMINYPPHTGIEPFVQRNGQLMGSVLSFPILCIINLMSYWASLEEYISEKVNSKRTSVEERYRFYYSLSKLPVLVNGDDILFPANDEFYEYWKKWTKKVGFQLSLGKNYISSQYLTVNSKLFRITRPNHGATTKIVEIPYYNVGLCTGQSKLSGTKNERVIPLWDIHNWVIRGASNPYRASRRFIHYNINRVKEATWSGRFNLFIAHLYGGLGFDKPSDVVKERIDDGYYQDRVPVTLDKERKFFKLRATRFQRRFAYHTYHEHSTFIPGNIGKISTRIGLIQENKPKSTFKNLAHNPVHPVLLPRYGPYRENVVHNRDFSGLDFIPGNEILMDEIEYTLKPKLRVSVPRDLLKKAGLLRGSKEQTVHQQIAFKNIFKSTNQLPVVGYTKPKPMDSTRMFPAEILMKIHKFAHPEEYVPSDDKLDIRNLFSIAS